MTALNRTITPKAIAEGALLATITAILTLIGSFIPIASFFTFLVVAVPIIIVIVRNNFTTGIISSFVAAFLVGLLAGPITAVFFYLQFMLMALVYGYLFKNKYGAGKILVIGTFVAAISTILIIALTMMVGQVSLEQQKAALFETVDRTIDIYKDYGMMEQFTEKGIDEEQLRGMLTGMVQLFIRILPTLLIIGSLFTAVTHFVMARIALKRLGHAIPKFPPFIEWNLPWYTIWGLIGGWTLYLFGDIYRLDILRIFGQNIMAAYGVLLFILGFAVIAFYIKKYRLSRLHRFIFFLTALLIINGFVLSTILIGMFDLVLDFRKINKKQEAN